MTRRRWLCVRLAAAGDFGGPLRRPSSDATRPCALACHGLRRAAAAFARRRQSCSADSPAGERRSLGLAPCPTQAVLLVRRTLSRLGAPRTATLSSAASASVGRRLPPIVAVVAWPRPAGPHVARPSALGRRSAPVCRHPLRAVGRRRCAPPPALGRAASPLLPRVPRPARARVLARALADRRLRRRNLAPNPRPASRLASRLAPPTTHKPSECSIIEHFIHVVSSSKRTTYL